MIKMKQRKRLECESIEGLEAWELLRAPGKNQTGYYYRATGGPLSFVDAPESVVSNLYRDQKVKREGGRKHSFAGQITHGVIRGQVVHLESLQEIREKSS